MPEKVVPGPVKDTAGIREAVCIHTNKIFDSCRDKDCIEDLRFYPTQNAQNVIDRALSVKAGNAELLYTYIDVEPVGFNRGFFTVDVRYFYRVFADAFVGGGRPVRICGLCIFDKRVVLFGSEGAAKIFRSTPYSEEHDEHTAVHSNLPCAVVEAVDPMVLNMKLVDVCECGGVAEPAEVPAGIACCFDGPLSFANEGRRIYVTLGQFSLIRLERESQLMIPSYDYCIPEKECSCGGEDDPCEIFRAVTFPTEEFFPPNTVAVGDTYRGAQNFCGA